MSRRTGRGLTAARAAAASVAVAAVLLGGAPGAVADTAPAVPTPTPAPLLSPLVGGGTASPTSTAGATPSDSRPPFDAGFGSVAGDLVLPVFDEIRVAAALLVGDAAQVPVPVPAASLEPGGGSSSNPTPWRPKAVIRIPVAVKAPSKGTTRPAARTKDEILWAAYAGRCAAAAQLSHPCHAPGRDRRGRVVLATRAPARRRARRGPAGPCAAVLSAIRDTDGGRYDGDSVWDRAAGPMQFIPGTWRLWGADGNGDGVRDPQNVEDAALAAANYLCAGGRDLSRPADLTAAVLSYNHSQRYLSTVLGIVQAVDSGQLAGP